MKSKFLFTAFCGISAAKHDSKNNNGTGSCSTNTTLPVVDLGYNIQQATAFNSTGRFYSFSNIRYAAPPVDDLRFAAPAPPAIDRTKVQTGQTARICAQANPSWLAIAAQFAPRYLAGERTFNQSSFTTAPTGFPSQDPTQTEDCLFLDVFVPEKVFADRGKGKKAPVLFWIYGGGYTVGSKTSSGNPAGLLERSMDNGQDGVIYVAPNYRLGAFGWLSGPTFQEEGGLANAGLYDQRFALEWVQKYIHLFGGDPDQVTVFGESAGGGSLVHQITAFGGERGPVPFQRAVPQSPGFIPLPSPRTQEQIYQGVLSTINITSLAQARAAPFSRVQLANILVTAASPYGGFTFGPVVDGIFTPSLPGQLLARGQFDRSLHILTGQNADEGLLFTSPFIATDADLRESLTVSLPTIAAFPDQLDYVLDVLYPPVFDGSQAQAYRDQIARAAAITAELGFICNARYLAKAYHASSSSSNNNNNNNHTTTTTTTAYYSYLFAVPPALHGQDVPYTYYNGDGATAQSAVVAPRVALALQDYITSFARDGDPNEPGVPFFKMYGDDAGVQVLNVTGIAGGRDPAANRRCDYWQKALYY